MASKPPKAYFSESEAARSLGVSVDDFRTLLKRYIIDREEDMGNVSVTTFHASDLLLLRLMMNKALATAGPAGPQPVAPPQNPAPRN